jgi:hypothetical protein
METDGKELPRFASKISYNALPIRQNRDDANFLVDSS